MGKIGTNNTSIDDLSKGFNRYFRIVAQFVAFIMAKGVKTRTGQQGENPAERLGNASG
jgi:hypothetical protein